MIARNMTLDNLNFVRPAYLTDQFPCTLRNIRSKDWLAVFRNPNYVISKVVDCMARFTVMLHFASILKASPEGEGFSPIPRMGQ